MLRPGGVAYLTIHSERLWTRMNTNRSDTTVARATRITSDIRSIRSSSRARMERDRVVFKMGPAMHHVNVFHSDRHPAPGVEPVL